MKKILLVALSFLFVGCIRTQYLPEEKALYYNQYLLEKRRAEILDERLNECLQKGEAIRRECQ